MLLIEQENSSRKIFEKQHSVCSLNLSTCGTGSNTNATNNRRSATMNDNESLRVVINCIYHIVEAIRREELITQIIDFSRFFFEFNISDNNIFYLNYSEDRLKILRNNFINELGI